MNIAQYRELKKAGHVTIAGVQEATSGELLKVYVKDKKLMYDQTTFSPSTGEQKIVTGQEIDLLRLQQQYAQQLVRRAELKRELEALERSIPEFKEAIADCQGLLEGIE